MNADPPRRRDGQGTPVPRRLLARFARELGHDPRLVTRVWMTPTELIVVLRDGLGRDSTRTVRHIVQ